MAMLQAKTRGRGRVAIFDAGLREEVGNRLELEHDLRAAVENGELRLEYQPLASLANGRVLGLEALVRWEHPRRGLLLPGPLRGAGRGVRAHRRPGQLGPRSRLRPDGALARHVPRGRRLLPGRQRLAPPARRASSCCRPLRSALEKSGLPAGALMLEITESGLVSDDGSLHGMLDELRDVRRAPRHRRLRHRVLVAQLSEAPAGELHQDRPLLRERARDPTPRTSASWPPSPSWATGSACGSSPRASRTASSATWPASWAATSTRATCWPSRAGPATSPPSGGPRASITRVAG